MRYYVVYERAEDGEWGAYPPDLPGVGIVGDSRLQGSEMIVQAIEMHIRGLIEDGLPVPQPSGEYVEITV